MIFHGISYNLPFEIELYLQKRLLERCGPVGKSVGMVEASVNPVYYREWSVSNASSSSYLGY
jgi:hypothetical protein